MPTNGIQQLTEEQAVKQIIQTIERAEPGEAPFALVLGAGFSFGLVPTVKELVSRHLPIWAEANGNVERYRATLARTSDADVAHVAANFWKKFVADNQGRNLNLKLTSSGLPDPNKFAEAYQAVFSPEFDSIVGAPADGRKFQRALMQLDRYRINAAHFLLASLLGAQPGRSRSSPLFKFDSAFSRLILTTNFDPFLQTALQCVNRLYYMSDTPDLGVSDEILDDHTDAIHLVYVHGSVHRRALAATEEEIRTIKEKNAVTLAPVLKRRGVIVLGYSGWDDAIVEALTRCGEFDFRLYWCGRASDPLAPGAFGPRVPEILRKRSACYVLTSGAGRFMQLLYNGLVSRLPRLLDNPAAQVRALLESLNFSDLSDLGTGESAALLKDGEGEIMTERMDLSTEGAAARVHPLEKARLDVIQLLTTIEKQFEISFIESASPAVEVVLDAQGRLIESAELAIGLGNYVEALAHCDEALKHEEAAAEKRATVLHLKAQALYGTEHYDSAIGTWTEIIEMPGIPPELVTNALLQRGLTHAAIDQSEDAVRDFARIIDLQTDADVATVGAARVNRGMALARLGRSDLAKVDYDFVIDSMPGAQPSTLAAALYHRARELSKQENFEGAIAQLNRVIGMTDAAEEYVARSIVERGFATAELLRRKPTP